MLSPTHECCGLLRQDRRLRLRSQWQSHFSDISRAKTVSYSYDAGESLTDGDRLAEQDDELFIQRGWNLTGSVNPNGTAVSYGYDHSNRLVALTNSGPNSTVISSYAYTLDALGNHTQVKQVEQLQTTPVVGQFTYAYDSDNAW